MADPTQTQASAGPKVETLESQLAEMLMAVSDALDCALDRGIPQASLDQESLS
jgi:hypothetical protein